MRVLVSLIRKSGDQSLQANVPRSVVQLETKVVWQDVENLINEVLVVLWLDLPVLVLVLKVSQLSYQRWLVVKETDGDVESSEKSLRVSLELWRVNVVSIDASEVGLGLRMIAEHISEEFHSELDTVVTFTERFRPLVLDLETFQWTAFISGHVGQTYRENDSQ